MASFLEGTCLLVDAERDNGVAVLIAHQHVCSGRIDGEVARRFPFRWLVPDIAEVAGLGVHGINH